MSELADHQRELSSPNDDVRARRRKLDRAVGRSFGIMYSTCGNARHVVTGSRLLSRPPINRLEEGTNRKKK